jgi:hypothetical protein
MYENEGYKWVMLILFTSYCTLEREAHFNLSGFCSSGSLQIESYDGKWLTWVLIPSIRMSPGIKKAHNT